MLFIDLVQKHVDKEFMKSTSGTQNWMLDKVINKIKAQHCYIQGDYFEINQGPNYSDTYYTDTNLFFKEDVLTIYSNTISVKFFVENYVTSTKHKRLQNKI